MTRAPTRPRVVIDTNLVLSALLFSKGRLTPLRLAWQNESIRPLVSRATAAELVRVLAYPKFSLSPDEQEELLSDYLPFCTSVVIPAPPPPTPPCRDPFDVPFLQLALAGKADALLSGDRDLLLLASASPIPILNAAEFLAALQP